MEKKLTAVIICMVMITTLVFPVNAVEFSGGESEGTVLSDSFETSEEDDYQGVFSDGKQEKDDDNIFVTDIESEDSIWSDGEEPEEIEQDSLPENAVAYINPLYQDVITEEDLKRPQEGLLNASDDLIYYTNVEDIVSEIRAQLVKRETVIAVGYQSSENYVPDFIDMAMEHTGFPLEGDYLKWQYAGCWQACSVNLTGDIYYHTIKYTVTYYTTYQQEQALNRSISLLLEDLNLRQKTDYEKIKSIYDFICSSVSYDYYHLNDEAYTLKYTAYAALVNKSAVCQGYAVLFYRLALEAGVDCRVITGMSMGEHHGWNIVKLRGLYYAVDSTWDAGCSQYNYFLKGSSGFDTDHIRDSEYKESVFQNNYPTSVNDYVVQTDDYVLEEEYVENDIIYTIQHGEATVTGYLGKPEVVAIPEKVKNAVVVKIGESAFSKCITLKQITIPATIRTIEDGNWVFGNKDLQWGAFWHCENLSEVIIAPNSKMSYIGAYSFCGCTALKSFSLPSSIKELGNNVFDACSSMTEIELPEGIEKIGFCAFADTAITEIRIPASCEQYLASYLLTQKRYTVADGNTVYKAIDGVLFTRYKQGWMLDAYPASRDDTEYTVPEDIEYVDGYSFQYNEKLHQINIGNQTVFNQSCIKCSINFVGDATDYVNEDGLIYSKDGKKLIKIENRTTGTIVVKDGVETIDSAAGYRGNFKEIILPEGVTRIGSGAFAESALEKIQLPNTLKIVENQAFYSCRNLKEIELPDSISEIQSQAFQDCASLVRAKLPAGLKTLRWNTFFDCVSLEEVIMPKVLEETELQVFANCEKIQSIILPNTLNKIGEKMFLCCSNLKQLTIPEQVTEIGCGAFRQCRTLQKIRIPEKTGYIGGDAFAACDLLQEIVVDAENPAYASLDGVLYNKQVTELIQWPGGKKGKLTIPSSVEKISEAESAFMGSYDYILSALSCASGMTDIEVESGNKYYASSDGLLYDKEKKILILCPQGKTGCVIVPEGIVSIGKRSFYKCHNISEVRLPSTLTDIEYKGFDECISLHTISLPNGLRKIGDGAFSSSGLGSGNMILPDTVEYIGEYAFANCSYPDRLVIPKSVQYIGKGAFAGYNNPEIKKKSFLKVIIRKHLIEMLFVGHMQQYIILQITRHGKIIC